MQTDTPTAATHPLWMALTLKLVGAVDVLRGAAMIVLPSTVLALSGVEAIAARPFVQALGFYALLLGGYQVLAAADPARHWPAPALSLMTKMTAPALFLATAARTDADLSTTWLLVPTYLIWWVPLSVVLWTLLDARSRQAERVRDAVAPVRELMEVSRAQTGETLLEITERRPQLVVFLRHFGCTFCRETLADLVDRRHDIEAHGLGVVLIHMGDETEAAAFLSHYGLEDLPRISDPAQHLYRAARLDRGSLLQLIGPKVWWRAIFGGALRRHGMGSVLGDGFQMPGAFVLHHGEVLYAFRHRSAADRPDYLELARCGLQRSAQPAA